MTLILYQEVNLSLTQYYKTDSWDKVCTDLYYYEMSLSLLDLRSSTKK